jgi:uncharacterized protein (TIGR02246 family)
VDESTARETIRPVLASLEEAWRLGDSAGWAAACAPDVDFINLLGMHANGREAVIAMHEPIFKGPYLNSTVAFTPERVRVLSDDAVLAIAPIELEIPSGPVAGTVSAIATMLFVRSEGDWFLASFQNTKCAATEANHTAIMLEAQAQK